MDLPVDLRDFLARRQQLEYDFDKCEAGRITLLDLDRLKLELFPMDVDNNLLDNSADPHRDELGCYLVRAVSLVAECDEYDPHGLLLWIPSETRLGSWDSSHTLIEAFDPSVTWAHIASEPLLYLNSFWGEERVGGLAPLAPWTRYEYDSNQPHWPRAINDGQEA
jgi:hypothetical protein